MIGTSPQVKEKTDTKTENQYVKALGIEKHAFFLIL